MAPSELAERQRSGQSNAGSADWRLPLGAPVLIDCGKREWTEVDLCHAPYFLLMGVPHSFSPLVPIEAQVRVEFDRPS